MVFAVRVTQSRVVCFARVAAIFVAITIGEETAKDAVFRVEDWEMAVKDDFDFRGGGLRRKRGGEVADLARVQVVR
tara:strand:+ start:1029 stop:1256 length:228 start_codon:yes stop_codon:yes gene_type:complete